MTNDKDNKLTAKQEQFCMYYATPGSETENNGLQSAKKAAYKGNDQTLTVVASENLRKPYLKKRIDEIKAVVAEELTHTRTIAIKMLTKNIENLTEKAENGDIQACNALTTCIRELNAISNLHSNTSFVTTSNKDVPQSEKEIEAGQEAAAVFKLKLANG